MAITLQTVLAQKVLPRAPSPNSSSPNPGIRSAITQFIPASPDASLNQGPTAFRGNDSALANGGGGGSNSSRMTLSRAHSSSSQGRSDASSAVVPMKSPGLGPMEDRKSMSAGAGSRRGIAHSTRILGVDEDTEEAFALSQLSNGKVDVSFEGTLRGRKGKDKARDGDDDEDNVGERYAPLFDVDLESGQPTASSSSPSSRAGRLLQIGSHALPWNKSKSTTTRPYQASAVDTANETSLDEAREDSLDFVRSSKTTTDHTADYSAEVDAEEDGLGAFDDDREQLLYGGADHTVRPGYFAPGDRSLGYNSIGGYGGAVGFEPLTWREGGWMVLSSLLVAVLMIVAILISIDVIDWPGDGIGKN